MKKLYFILAPFAMIYGGIIALRNLLFDLKILPNIMPQIPSIGIGNLNVGGTGKSVLVDYLITYFKQKKNPLVISRGYKRKTRGVIIANDKSSALTIGDEPYQFFSKHKIGVIVCENRKDGLNILMQKNLKPDVIIFDDIMQHRYVSPHCLVITTSFNQIFFDDHLLPLGRLREQASQVKRANIILVTKCPDVLSIKDQLKIKHKINPKNYQKVFFTKVLYGKNIINKKNKKSLTKLKLPFLLITGIANSDHLVSFLKNKSLSFEHLKYSNHYNFSLSDIKKIKQKKQSKIILTTEKDFGRLRPYFNSNELFYLPIEMDFFTKKREDEFKLFLQKKINVF